MIDELLLDILTKLGFPIFVAVWFMIRTEKVIQRNTDAFLQMSHHFEYRELEELRGKK